MLSGQDDEAISKKRLPAEFTLSRGEIASPLLADRNNRGEGLAMTHWEPC
jgi:hypothetical protein